MKRKIDTHYEYLTKLYLRLKGYLTSNLIIHSPQRGLSQSEIDIVAMRNPYHSQDYRGVNVEDYLECSNSRIEIIVGDVKNTQNFNKAEFNDSLKKSNNAIIQLINWLGLYKEITNQHAEKFEQLLQLKNIDALNGFAHFDEDLDIGKFRIRFIIFCPSLPKWNGKGIKYVHGEEMVDFIWECLNKVRNIPECSRFYSFAHWNELLEYVIFFKCLNEKPTKEQLENGFRNMKFN